MADNRTTVDYEQYFQDLDDIICQQPELFPAGHLQQGQLPPQADIQVDIQNLKDVYDKVQKKVPQSEQRIDKGVVNMTVQSTSQVECIRVFVQRTPQAAQKVNFKLGRVELPLSELKQEIYNTHFYVDLDSLYKTPTGEMVYWLDRVEVEERNIWQLVVFIRLIDGSEKNIFSKEFRIRTKPRSKDTQENPSKRKRSDPSSCASSDQQSSPPYSDGSPYSGYSPSGSARQGDKVLTDYLEAQRARIQHLTVVKSISTPSADIAYHLKLTEGARRRSTLEEGDVIAFLTNPSTGETEIEKLSDENSKRAVMAGVISRSAYLYANAPSGADTKKGDTDTVCVIGLVKVKVMGTVQNGERVYAALDHPGVAIPETQIPLRRMADRVPTLLGQALESRMNPKLDSVQLVNCFVSIVLGIQSQQIANAIDNVQDRIHIRIKGTLEEDRKRRIKGLRCKLIPLFVLAGLLIFLLYELLAPGSMFHYWRCKQGCIKGHTASFKFSTHDHQYPSIRGIEFTWPGIKKKLDDLDKVDPYNATGAHYYLNLDRCAYGGVYLKHEPQIRGPEVFVVNSTCTGVLFEEKNKWKFYGSAEYIECHPAYG